LMDDGSFHDDAPGIYVYDAHISEWIDAGNK